MGHSWVATHEWPLFKFGLKNFFQAKFGLEFFFQAKNGFKKFFREIFEKWPLHCATLWILFKKGPKNFLTVGHSCVAAHVVASFQIWLEKFFSSQIWLRIFFPSQKWLQKIFSRDFWKVATPLCHTMDPLQKRSEKFFDSGPLMSGHSWVATFQIWLEKIFSSQIWLRIFFPSQKWLQKIFSRDFWKVATPLCHTMDPLQKRSEKFFDSGPLMSGLSWVTTFQIWLENFFSSQIWLRIFFPSQKWLQKIFSRDFWKVATPLCYTMDPLQKRSEKFFDSGPLGGPLEWPLFKFGLKIFFQAKFGLEFFFQAKNGFKKFFREIFEKWPLHCATLWIHFKKGPKNFLTVGHSWVATFQIWLEKIFSSQIWLRIFFPSQKCLQKIFSRDFWKVATPLCHTMDPLQKRSEKFFDSGPLMSGHSWVATFQIWLEKIFSS